jgi:hypothetical protein
VDASKRKGEGRQVDFAEVDRRYEELKRQYDAGLINTEQFDEQLRALMIQDEQGRWWAKSRDTGAWSYHDGTRWVASDPPGRPAHRPGGPAGPPDPSPGPTSGGYVSPGPSDPGYGATGGGYVSHGPSTAPQTVSQGLAIVFYAAAIFIPLAGAVIWFIYRTNPNPADQAIARNTGIIAIVAASFYFLVCVCLSIGMGL